MLSNNQQVFLELVRSGLWEKETRLSQYDSIDFNEVYRLAEEQSLVGLVAAGIEHVVDVKVPQEIALQFVGTALQLEQQNSSMNAFIGKLIEKMRNAGIYTLLVKGQGIAQCYERPLWRASGDVDFFLSNDNVKKAIDYLKPIASRFVIGNKNSQHVAMTITPWIVELHGSLRSNLCCRVDRVLDDVQYNIFYKGHVRSWMNGSTQVFLPQVDEDIIHVFSHILEHFFRAGVGYRQICDWCRLLWTYKNKIDIYSLEEYLRKMRLMSEWKTFASLAVNYLGMPEDAMPFYSSSEKWKSKAERVNSFVVEVGNFGQNRDRHYFSEHTALVRKSITFKRILNDTIRQTAIFPLDAPKFFLRYVKDRIIETLRQ